MDVSGIADHVIGTFLSLVQGHFLGEPDDRCVRGVGDNYRFNTDRSQATIWIGDQFPETPDRGEQRPAIVGRRGTLQWRFGSLYAGLRSLDIPTGAIEYSNLVSAGIVLQCASSEGVEAERLATELLQLVLMMESQIVRRSKIQQVWSAEVGEEQPIEIKGAEIEWSMVPLSVAVMVQGEFGVEPVDPDILRGNDPTYTQQP